MTFQPPLQTRSLSASMSAVAPTPGRWLQRRCACGGRPEPDGECEECRKKRGGRLQRSGSGPDPDRVPSVVHEVLREPGRPLDPATRSIVEPRFGHDFSRVRVHADARSADSARAVNARAYAVGRDVVFGAGQYSPATSAGLRLLSHELAHVVQQRGAAETGEASFLSDARSERDADVAADAVLAGRLASVAERADRPMLAKFSETKRLTEPDGAEVAVDRIITPGKCISKPETRTGKAGDVGKSQAFLEFDFCKGRVGATVRGEVNYGDAIDKARTAASNLARNIASQPPDQALETFKNEVRQIAPEANVKVNFQAPGVRITVGGTGQASGEEGASGKATAGAQVDIGPVTVGGEISVEGGTDKPTETKGTLTVKSRDRSRQDRNCFVCVCSDPKIVFQCRRIEPPSAGPPPAPQPKPLIVPLFFQVEQTEPREGWEAEYDKALELAISRIREGYTIARIEGNASPEGRGQKRKGSRFVGNIELAQLRADEAKKDLVEKAQKQALLAMRGARWLRAVIEDDYPVRGTGELFGSTEKGEVGDRNLFRHLQKQLGSPAGDDQLAERHVTGEGLPEETRQEVEAQIEEFRTGQRGDRKLRQSERLEAVYRPLRRALIYLDPPPAPKPNLNLTPDIIERIIGKEIPCTDEHRKLFEKSLPPKAEMFTGECTEPGKRTQDPGPAQP